MDDPPSEIPVASRWRGRVKRLLDHWSGIVRAAETAVIIALLLGAVAAGPDVLLATILLAAAWIVAGLGIGTAPEIARRWKILLVVAVAVIFGLLDFGLWRHFRESSPPLPTPSASEIAKEVARLEATPTDDLRGSFNIIYGYQNKMHVSYVLRNVGKNTAVVIGVGLYEIGSSYKYADVELCTEAKAFQDFVIGGPSFGLQMGIENGHPYRPSSPILVDGKPPVTRGRLEIAPGMITTVDSDFDIDPRQAGSFAVTAFCPFVETVDINNVGGMAVCPGVALVPGFPIAGRMSAIGPYRILPHAEGVSCPVIRHPTNPPAASPPSPAPPETPAKK